MSVRDQRVCVCVLTCVTLTFKHDPSSHPDADTHTETDSHFLTSCPLMIIQSGLKSSVTPAGQQGELQAAAATAQHP